MKINWILRLKNKATLVSLIAIVITFVYQICGIFGIVPAVSQGAVENFFELVVKLLVLLGIVVDPTTAGINDSERAMTYEIPKQ